VNNNVAIAEKVLEKMEALASGLLKMVPVVVVIAVGGVGTVAAIAAAGLGFKIEVVEGDGGGADNGQEDKAIGQEGGVHCYQAGGEVDEKQPWVGFGFGQIEVVGTGGGAQGQQC